MNLDKKSLKFSQDWRKKNLPVLRAPRLKEKAWRVQLKKRRRRKKK